MFPQAASSEYQAQQAIAGTTAAAVDQAWSQMGDDFDASWRRLEPTVLELVTAGRAAAVRRALTYTPALIDETDQFAPSDGILNAAAFLTAAPDGRSVTSLYREAVIGAKASIAGGATVEAALAQSGRWLQMTTLTLLADTRREVYSADIGSRPAITGYTRMLNAPSCSRCIILAGKWFRWNTGFARHPRCDCQHIPSSEDRSGDFRTDPYAAFRAMTAEQQDRSFGRINARAIRDGADIYRVVNIGGRGLATARGAARFGTPSRMTIDDIYRNAGTRTNAIRMMREQGYIVDRGQVAVPMSPGVRTDAQVIAAGRGKGAVTVGGRPVATARASRFDAAVTGRRDPLNRATMTAAERRLYDAHYRLDYALRTGTMPRGVRLSSADVHAQSLRLTAAMLAELRRTYEQQLRHLSSSSADGVRRLAEALGIRIRPDGAVSPLTASAGRKRRRVARSGS